VIRCKQVFKQDSSNADFEIQNFLAWKKQGKRLNLVGKLSYGIGPSLRWLGLRTNRIESNLIKVRFARTRLGFVDYELIPSF
jgi:hypothetical protein